MSQLLELIKKLRVPAALGPIVALLACALGFLAIRSWLIGHDATVRLDAAIAAEKRLTAQADQRERARDASLAGALAQINAAKQRVNTPAKAAAAIPQALPPLPQPVVLHMPAETVPPAAPASGAIAGSSAAESTDEPPPAIASIPQVDLKPIYDFLEDCRANESTLATTREDLSDEHAKLAAITAERDAAVRAAGKGTIWSRLGHNSKWFLLGAVTAAAALAVTAHP